MLNEPTDAPPAETEAASPAPDSARPTGRAFLAGVLTSLVLSAAAVFFGLRVWSPRDAGESELAAFRRPVYRVPASTDEPSRLMKTPHLVPEESDWASVLYDPPRLMSEAITRIAETEGRKAVVPLLEIARGRYEPPGGRIRKLGIRLAGLPEGATREDAYRAAWSEPMNVPDGYAMIKAAAYRGLDPRFVQYFEETDDALIRLDEIRWGGVERDGIPPLKNPDSTAADMPEAAYLADSDVVFGVHLGGEAIAYPKRILGWHEMVKDTVGGTEICGVYCTLCGSMIVYLPDHAGVHHELGTSGFLYRSNKLMYDHATKSLWSTLRGKPVVGPLVKANPPIELRTHPCVTTTWGEWRRRHPGTRVPTLNTDHLRDYSEGAAYRDYFATDDLMFSVPTTDDRLRNKQDVLILRSQTNPDRTVAVSTALLSERPVLHHTLGDQELIILTDQSGASRVFEAGDPRIDSYDGKETAADSAGRQWTLSETALTSEGQTRPRYPAHRAFWFGWSAAYPDTELVK